MAKILVGALLLLGQAGCFSGDSRHTPPVGIPGAEKWQVGVSPYAAGGDWIAWPAHSLRLRGGSFTNEEGGESAVPLPYGSTRQSMEVAADKIGVIIGRAGSTIKELERMSQCQIWVDPKTNVPGRPSRVINVAGLQHRVVAAKRLIQDKIELQESLYTTAGGILADGTVRETIYIPERWVGAVIGKGGSVIKSIMQLSNARLFIHGEAVPGKMERPVTVSGTLANVQKAKVLVAQRIPQYQQQEQPQIVPQVYLGQQQQQQHVQGWATPGYAHYSHQDGAAPATSSASVPQMYDAGDVAGPPHAPGGAPSLAGGMEVRSHSVQQDERTESPPPPGFQPTYAGGATAVGGRGAAMMQAPTGHAQGGFWVQQNQHQHQPGRVGWEVGMDEPEDGGGDWKSMFSQVTDQQRSMLQHGGVDRVMGVQ